MSVDTRTPRTPTGDRSSGFDDVPALSMVKVPSDPAQVIVNHASFRVQLPGGPQTASARVAGAAYDRARAARVPAGAAPGVGGRRAPVVWSGRSAPGDPGATGLLQAVRGAGVRHPGDERPAGEQGSTQVIPRVDLDDDTVQTPAVGAPRGPAEPRTPLLPQMRSAAGDHDEHPGDIGEFTLGAPPARPDYGDYGDHASDAYEPSGADGERSRARHRGEDVRHAYYPGRRLNLGVVLLPLRVFLGFISVYAGMGKLCDPVYFDGGKRGSLVTWLGSLHPWALAEPLRDFALQHPVGAGLTVAFLQVLVGVLTVLGLWQRAVAVLGALLSAALLVTVSWRTVPVYDAPDIICLAAWSPLIIAGAPVYSVDGRLAAEAWRRLGPRATLWDLRRRVLRRGGLIGAFAVGVTLLVGALLGGAVRDADRVSVPGPGEAPRNSLPGRTLPGEPSATGSRQHRSPAATGTPGAGASASPSQPAAPPSAPSSAVTEGAGQPGETQGTGQVPPPPQQQAPAQPPATTSGPSTGGAGAGPTSDGGTNGTPSGGTSTSGGSSSGGSSSGGSSGGSLVGGLLG
ncbi:DoxX family membrane protein [Streptomyces sp. NPDC058045]|uniref:DoxX family membrane protein n=1 Tax=Streptomyces sp. NPDC058045 TaxID=3346311 RepID=UPI0036E43BA2